MKDLPNPFEAMLQPGIESSDLIREGFETIEVFNNRKEVIKILIADAGDNRFAFGYDIYFLSGRNAQRLPSLEMGYCTSRVNAILYFLGYILQYNSMFSDSAIHEVKKLIATYSQPKLF